MPTSSGLRRTARRGRLTLKPQADFRDSLSLHCIARHPSVLFAPSRQRFFGCLTSVSRGIVITAHRHIRPLQAKRAVQSGGQKPLRSLLTRTAAILPRNGSVGSAYSAMARERASESKRQGGGGSFQTEAGRICPPAPPKPLILRSL